MTSDFLKLLLPFKYAEMNTSVLSELTESGELGEIMISSVFKNEPAAGLQYIAAEYDMGKLVNIFLIIGRICENYIIGSFGSLQEPESIRPDRR